jgi:chorismate mutase
MAVRGIRGATVADDNQPESIISATMEMLETILASNPTLIPDDIGSVIFTVTDDLNSTYPAKAARQLGWVKTPLMCAREIPVPGSLSLCIRVLVHWNTDQPQANVRHIYLRAATKLRPDLTDSV